MITTYPSARSRTPKRCALDLPRRIAAKTAKCVASQLDAHRVFAGRGIQCDVCYGTLYLRGQVPSFYLKQLAQELARKADGVVRVVNLLQVEPWQEASLSGLSRTR